jgi:hypothetical protein
VRLRVLVVVALAVAIGLASAVAPFASSSPDGLERVAADHGFARHGRAHDAPAPDYAFPGIHDERLATGVAGFAGTLVVFGAGWGVLALVARPRRRTVA